MSETDRIIEALRQNPYEKIHRRLRTCSWCGEGIFEADNYYKIAGVITSYSIHYTKLYDSRLWR